MSPFLMSVMLLAGIIATVGVTTRLILTVTARSSESLEGGAEDY